MRVHVGLSVLFGSAVLLGLATPLFLSDRSTRSATNVVHARVVRVAPIEHDDARTSGARVFANTCAPCHQPTGVGVPHVFPPLAGSDFLAADKDRAIEIVLGGLRGAITVNGLPFDGEMPSQAKLSDDDIANVLTYVRSSWGNAGDAVVSDEVASRRAMGTPVVTVSARSSRRSTPIR